MLRSSRTSIAALFLAAALAALQARAGQFLVDLQPMLTQAQRTALTDATKVSRTKAVPSLGKGVEVWDTSMEPKEFERLLAAHGAPAYSKVTGDYRNLFEEIPHGMDVAPDVEKALNVIKQRPTTAVTHVVLMRPEALNAKILLNGFDQSDGFAKPGSLRLNLLPGKTAVVARQSSTQHAPGVLDWSGTVLRVAEDPVETPLGPVTELFPKGIATLSVNDGNIVGRVSVGAETYVITPLGKGFHAIVKINPAKFPLEHPPSHKTLEKAKISFNLGEAELKDRAPKKNSDGTHNDTVSAPVITVGVAYTKSAALALGTALTPSHFADALINITNVSYKNSGVGAVVALSGTKVIDFVETDFDADIARLKRATTGPLADLKRWRHDISANVVVLIVSLDRYCGLAGGILASVGDAYALVSQTCALDNLSFAHEIGHLQGARHDETSDPSDTPFRYGHGYRYPPKWRTIMAYDCDQGCNRIPYWSNPNVKFDGVPMGTPVLNHDARVLTETAAQIHSLRP